MNKIRILIADDHPLMRDALVTALEAELDMLVIGQASDGHEAVTLAQQLYPDVILMDLLMPGMDGITAVTAILASQPAIKILILTSLSDEHSIQAAAQAGAMGYITKEAIRPELLRAIRTVAGGEPYLPPEITLKLLHGMRDRALLSPPAPPAQIKPALTARQQEVLTLLGQGYSNREIALALYISETTVRSHTLHILNRLGLESRAQAIVYATQHKT